MKNILNTHFKLLKKHHPVTIPVQLKLYQKPIEGNVGLCVSTSTLIVLKVQIKDRREDEILHTLAHEYKHALQRCYEFHRYETEQRELELEAHDFAFKFNNEHLHKNKPQLIWGRYWGPGSEELNKELKEKQK